MLVIRGLTFYPSDLVRSQSDSSGAENSFSYRFLWPGYHPSSKKANETSVFIFDILIEYWMNLHKFILDFFSCYLSYSLILQSVPSKLCCLISFFMVYDIGQGNYEEAITLVV